MTRQRNDDVLQMTASLIANNVRKQTHTVSSAHSKTETRGNRTTVRKQQSTYNAIQYSFIKTAGKKQRDYTKMQNCVLYC